MKRFLLSVLPWIITAIAVVFVCKDLDWSLFVHELSSANIWLLFIALILTVFSYLLRSWRWIYFFPDRRVLKLVDSVRVLFLGFFMNNVLPARAGELVRAHMGSVVTKQKRTLVLATVASERLVDGLTISIFFVIFAFGSGNLETSTNLLYEAVLFAAATVAVVLMLAFRSKFFVFSNKVGDKLNNRYSDYAISRMQLFIDGLSPLCSLSRIPVIALFSLIIWSIELLVYISVAYGFQAQLSLSSCVLFMVAVNFSSLVPAAPGGIGVIELIASSILMSLGLHKEVALSMVISQHIIQYFVVGVPGLFVMFRWKKSLGSLEEDIESNE